MIAYILILWILIELKAPMVLIVLSCISISAKIVSLAQDIWGICTERYQDE